jgi:hypothetical protein
MSIKTTIAAVLLLSATALPALAEDYANDPARPYGTIEQQQQARLTVWDLIQGNHQLAKQQGLRQEARNPAAETAIDVGAGSSPSGSQLSPHAYDYLQPGHSIPAGG